MTFTAWLQREVWRLAAGGTITIPAGTFFLDGCIKLPTGVTGLTIRGAGEGLTTLIRTGRCSTAPAFYFDRVDNCSLEDLTIDGRAVHADHTVWFRSSATVAVRRVTIIGGTTSCLQLMACNGVVVDTVTVGGLGSLGPGLGRGIHLQSSTLNAAVETVRAYDDNIRHLCCGEDNLESATFTDVVTPQSGTYAAVDLHGKLEGNASQGSITINLCAGRLNIGNDTNTQGSHATVTNHDGQGKIVGVQVNSVLRYQNVTNATITLYGNGQATNMGAPE